MFERFCYHYFGTRYVFVDAWAFKRLKSPGDESLEHVARFDAHRVLRAMAHGEPALLERLYRAIDGGGTSMAHGNLRRPFAGEDPRVGRVLQSLGLDHFSVSSGSAPVFARVYLLRPARHGRLRSVRQDSPESRGIDRALTKLGNEQLVLRGDSYRLVQATPGASVPQRDTLETLSEEQLFLVLRELAAEPMRTEPRKAALAELLSLAETQRKKTGHTDLLLLRRQRSYARAAEASGPAITPSKLREQIKKPVSLVLVDEWGNAKGGLGYKIESPKDGTIQGAFPSSGEKRHEDLQPCTVAVNLGAHPDDWRERAGRPIGWLVKGLSVSLTDAHGCPLPSRKFKASFQNGATLEGTTDASGRANLEDTPSYPVSVAFENFDAEDFGT